ncbi:MAG: class I SAM-dependent rRNA methyltransferase [Chthoniobacterales bacterium]|nr:class I SAM-dependent rRNA methyltransferase [Chthoniobacterales bacterium]
MGGVIVRARSRILHGHDWIYRSEIVKTFGKIEDGDVVSIRDGKDNFLGSGIYSLKSPIAVRRFSRSRQRLDSDFLRRRIVRAWELRKRSGVDGRPCRVFWSEADGLPGLILDKYGENLVLQTLTAGVEREKRLISEVAMEVVGARNVFERNDAVGRASEGLPRIAGPLIVQDNGMEEGKVDFELNGVRFEADLLRGQKTGFYLDQVENYSEVAQFACGKRVLDCFCNGGGFGIFCALRGATEVVGVDSSEVACELARKNAGMNGVSCRFEEGDVFDFMRREARQGRVYDLIVLDPPPFARSGTSPSIALRAYRDLHRCAGQLLTAGGLLATFCCSQNIGAEDFLGAIAEGLWDAGKTARVVRGLSQPPDHPVLVHIPETNYLKGYILEILR